MIHTDDLFLGAYALMRGGELQDVEVRGMNGRRTAVFRIDGSEEAKRELPEVLDDRLGAPLPIEFRWPRSGRAWFRDSATGSRSRMMTSSSYVAQPTNSRRRGMPVHAVPFDREP